MSTVIAFDTSNYTTSLSVVKDGRVTENRKIPVPVEKGGRGVRQSDAVFHHTVNLAKISRGLEKTDYDAVGVSDKPRNVDGSYMPCFLAGTACASVLADTLGLPLYRFSHQQGHVRAALYSAGRSELYRERIIAFHLSGGTTEMLLCDGGDIRAIGGTLDISAGKLIDRTGVKLGLDFPCGAALDALARSAGDIKVKIADKGFYCNLSGCENTVDGMLAQGEPPEIISAYVFACVRTAVENMLRRAASEYGSLPVLFSGGVSSSAVLREYFTAKYSVIFGSPEYCCDNAAGTALLTEEALNAVS